MTGYTVKKKNLDYYKFSGTGGAVNVSAKEMHAKYVELLNQFKLPEELLPILTDVLRKKFAEKEMGQEIDVSNIKKRIATLTTNIKTVKNRYAIGKIDEDVYKDVIAELERDLHKAEGELERASVNLSNLATYIDDTIAFACNLSSYWQKMDFEMCQGIQKLVFPEGANWDKESRSYRTTNYNSFFEMIHCVSDRYKNRQEKERGKSCDLSSLVGHHIEISNRFLHDYVAVFQIAKQCKTSLATCPPFQRRVWVDCKGNHRNEKRDDLSHPSFR